jgi:hypothetical protein
MEGAWCSGDSTPRLGQTVDKLCHQTKGRDLGVRKLPLRRPPSAEPLQGHSGPTLSAAEPLGRTEDITAGTGECWTLLLGWWMSSFSTAGLCLAALSHWSIWPAAREGRGLYGHCFPASRVPRISSSIWQAFSHVPPRSVASLGDTLFSESMSISNELRECTVDGRPHFDALVEVYCRFGPFCDTLWSELEFLEITN